MGVHTGDSITVAPAQTLTDVEYQRMRDAAFACIRRVGVETGGSNVQFALDPRDRPPGHHRDEPAGLALVGAGLEGDRVPDRQDRRQARRRLHARRDPQRHHAGHAGQLRAGHRLRRHEGAALGVREAARHDAACSGTQMQSVGEAMAIGRTFPESLQKALRSLEHGRAGLNCDPAEAELERASRRRAAGRRRRADAGPDLPDRRAAPARRDVEELHEACRIDPWFLDQLLAIVEDRQELAAVDGPDALDAASVAAGQAPGLQRRPAGPPLGRRPRPTCGRLARRAGVHPDVQDGRHVRRRVRRRDAVPLLDLGGRERGPAVGPAAGRHPRLGTEPHRPGHRVRLLLRARQLRPARRRLRDGDGQLQPGDGVDRLRHVRPAVLRAAHRRGRAPRDRRRDGRRRRRATAGHRRPRRADAAQAGVAASRWS